MHRTTNITYKKVKGENGSESYFLRDNDHRHYTPEIIGRALKDRIILMSNSEELDISITFHEVPKEYIPSPQES